MDIPKWSEGNNIFSHQVETVSLFQEKQFDESVAHFLIEDLTQEKPKIHSHPVSHLPACVTMPR